MPAKKTETIETVETTDAVEAPVEVADEATTDAKKPVAKKAPAKKPAAKKPATKKAIAKKETEEVVDTAEAPAKKAPAKKTPAKKAPAKKPVAKKETEEVVEAEKAPAKKAPAKKTPVKSAAKKPAAPTATSVKKRVEKKNLVEIPKSEVSYQATGRRKDAVARVRLIPGTGRVYCNNRKGAEYFGRQQHVDFALAALKAVDQGETFDVIAILHGGGVGGQAGALRLGIARALLEVNPDYRGELKRLGMLKRDPRVVERKKYGLKKARKRPQFSKR